MQYVVIGTSPFAERSVVFGPFRSLDKATEARHGLEARGYIVETEPLSPLSEMDEITYLTNDE